MFPTHVSNTKDYNLSHTSFVCIAFTKLTLNSSQHVNQKGFYDLQHSFFLHVRFLFFFLVKKESLRKMKSIVVCFYSLLLAYLLKTDINKQYVAAFQGFSLNIFLFLGLTVFLFFIFHLYVVVFKLQMSEKFLFLLVLFSFVPFL